MDDYALQEELESMAANAWSQTEVQEGVSAVVSVPPEPIGKAIQRWQTLFHLSTDDAVDRLVAHRNNLTRPRVSDVHWDAIHESVEVQGHDRESYEYELWLQQKRANLPSIAVGTDESEVNDRIKYLVELDGPLGSVRKVMKVAELEAVPEIRQGWSVENQQAVNVCCIDAAAKEKILKWLISEEGGGGGWEPTILVDPRSLVK